MNAIEAIDTINSWRRILVEGDPGQIDVLLENIERSLLNQGWKRRPDFEAKMRGSLDRADGFRCFAGGPSSGPQLILGLRRVSQRRVRGGSYSLLSAGEPAEVATVVDDVIKHVITPAAFDAGVKVTISRLGLESQVPQKTMSALDIFSDLAAGMWPLSADMERAWHRFVAAACRESAAFDVDELVDWFVANGWSADDARKLKDRFLAEAALLAEYDEE